MAASLLLVQQGEITESDVIQTTRSLVDRGRVNDGPGAIERKFNPDGTQAWMDYRLDFGGQGEPTADGQVAFDRHSTIGWPTASMSRTRTPPTHGATRATRG